MTEIAMCLLPFGVAAILWVVFQHRSTMAHLQARRDGSVVFQHRSTMAHLQARRDGSIGNEYDRGVRDGLHQAVEALERHGREGWSAAGYPAYVELLKKAAEHD